MTTTLKARDVRKYAGVELNALAASGVIPRAVYEKSRVSSTGTPVYDLNGELLFRRIPLKRGRNQVAYADVAANPALKAVLLGVSYGAEWDARDAIAQAVKAARKHVRRMQYDKARFVAFSYPKIAVQFLRRKEEVLMLEWGTWTRIPAARRQRREPMQPSNFERWSLLEEMPATKLRANKRAFNKRVEQLGEISRTAATRRIDLNRIYAENFRIWDWRRVTTSEIHYTHRLNDPDHTPCYELRGQETSVWCVGASVQMLLDFYRYEYTQTRIAQALGLGTPTNPNGLPYARVGDVVTELENLSSNALSATMVTNPTWTFFNNEIRANRPVISFVPGHSRTVAGTTQTWLLRPVSVSFRGLLVYDPWPPNAGVITRWENFDAQTYQYGYSAEVTTI